MYMKETYQPTLDIQVEMSEQEKRDTEFLEGLTWADKQRIYDELLARRDEAETELRECDRLLQIMSARMY